MLCQHTYVFILHDIMYICVAIAHLRARLSMINTANRKQQSHAAHLGSTTIQCESLRVRCPCGAAAAQRVEWEILKIL